MWSSAWLRCSLFWICQGSIFRSENDIYSPPPSENDIFSPLATHCFFLLPSWPFCLNSSLFCNYFTRLLPLFSFSFPFLPFSFTYSPLFSSPFHIFSPKWHRLISPSQGGGGIFQDSWNLLCTTWKFFFSDVSMCILLSFLFAVWICCSLSEYPPMLPS